jgi:c-di-GMP-binding flagellar brake protein YcgR
MLEHTRPAELDPAAGLEAWSEFRVSLPQERLRLLRELRDGNVPVILTSPCGGALTATLWTLDTTQERLNLSVDSESPALMRVVDANEAVAVAYLDSVKLQFELQAFMVVRGTSASALQCALPREIYRFQRRKGYRVRVPVRHAPVARLAHPGWPEMRVALRIIDVSSGGCALWLPHDVPPLQAGTRLSEVQIELDREARFSANLELQHVSAIGGGAAGSVPGARLGCAWVALGGTGQRVLQRWIDRTQQRRRLLALE